MSNFKKALCATLAVVLLALLLSAGLVAYYYHRGVYTSEDARVRKGLAGQLDLLICGASAGQVSINPDTLDDVLGTRSYNLGSPRLDDAVLRKPGRFNIDDFEVMKTHAEKGANIIEKLLSDVKDSYFVNVAKNIALYHHERWDGSGYPEQRSGENIPMEARIMALADVYDALVSKRCYKERMSFREARDVILASMGKQFDPQLKDCFLNCQDQLMEYYCSVDH